VSLLFIGEIERAKYKIIAFVFPSRACLRRQGANIVLYIFGILRCMSLQKDIQGNIKEAMLAKDAIRLSVMRSLTAAFTNELVAKGQKPIEELSDEDALTVIRRAVKQRKESIDQFRKGNREDLVAGEEAELVILETFLPASLPREEIEKIARAKKEELGITDLPAHLPAQAGAGKSKAGQLMSALMKDLKGKADGADVKAVVDSLFQ